MGEERVVGCVIGNAVQKKQRTNRLNKVVLFRKKRWDWYRVTSFWKSSLEEHDRMYPGCLLWREDGENGNSVKRE